MNACTVVPHCTITMLDLCKKVDLETFSSSNFCKRHQKRLTAYANMISYKQIVDDEANETEQFPSSTVINL
jgi:hypothetical protein